MVVPLITDTGGGDTAMKAKTLLKSMIKGDGETVLLDEERVPIHDLGSHVQPAADGYISVVAPLSPGGAGAHQMTGGSGPKDENGMGGFVFAQGCGKILGVPPEFCVGRTDKKHMIVPLCGGQRADSISQDAQIRLAKISNEVGGRV